MQKGGEHVHTLTTSSLPEPRACQNLWTYILGSQFLQSQEKNKQFIHGITVRFLIALVKLHQTHQVEAHTPQGKAQGDPTIDVILILRVLLAPTHLDRAPALLR